MSRGPWKHTISFIAVAEQKHQNEEIRLHEMVSEIIKGFEKGKWIDHNVGEDYQMASVKPGLTKENHDELTFLCEELYDLEIDFKEDPDVDLYDLWKDRLYDWADSVRIWIEPTMFFAGLKESEKEVESARHS